MPVFNDNIKKLTKANTDFRRELFTNVHCQVVLMCIEPGEDIGEETIYRHRPVARASQRRG